MLLQKIKLYHSIPGGIAHGGSPLNPRNSAVPLGRLIHSAAFLLLSSDCYLLPDLASAPLPPQSAIIQPSHLLDKPESATAFHTDACHYSTIQSNQKL